MKYYKVKKSTGKEVGFVPQLVEDIYPVGTLIENSVTRLSLFNRPGPKTIAPGGLLHKKAKVTDLFSAIFLSGQLFVSDKLKNILCMSKNAGVSFLPTSIFAKDKEYKSYWVIQPYITDCSFLDAKNSEFGYENIFEHKMEKRIVFNTSEDFLAAYKKDREDGSKIVDIRKFFPLTNIKIAIKEDCGLDFFSFTPSKPTGISYFVSEDLKNKIEEAGCTGIVFTEPNQ